MNEKNEFLKFSRDLEKHHALFYVFWEMGELLFTDQVDRAAIQFDATGQQIAFLVNKSYWDSLSSYEQRFVICHECLHVIFNHGARVDDQLNAEAINIALDLVVNHALVNKFGFEKEKLPQSFCWTSSVFPGQDVADNECFEFYWNIIKQHAIKINVTVIDDHDRLRKSDWQSLGTCVNDKLSQEEKKSIENYVNSLDHSKGWWEFVDISPTTKKRKWETVISKWSRSYLKQDISEVEQWARLNRRFLFLTDDLLLPTEMEVETDDEDRIELYFFQDCSYSCYHLKDRFFNAAKSLPEDRFDVKLFTFDTRVYKSSLKSGKLYGFNGTRFDIIEQYLQALEPHPRAIFIITDGRGNEVIPRYPDRWFFFLSENYTHYIPPKSHVYDLRDFE